MKKIVVLQQKRERRHKRVRAKIFGTEERPRLTVFRSNNHMYAQLVNDNTGKTIVASSDMGVKEAAQKTMTEKARLVGVELAHKAKAKGVTKVVFDKGRFKYAGAVAALAQSVRDGGISF